MSMDFLKELHESRYTRNVNNVKSLSYNDCKERIYLILLVLEMLRHSKSSKAWTAKYCKATKGFEDYKIFRLNGTDLYNLLYFVASEDGYTKLKNPESAKKIKDSTKIPFRELHAYIIALSQGKDPVLPSNFLIKMEQGLGITNSDYKFIRRSLGDWGTERFSEKQNTATKLLFAVRAKLRSTDVIDDYEAWVTKHDAESYYTVDREPTISTPDISTTGQDVALYRYLIGGKDLAMLKKFLEQAKDGKAVSPSMMQAYQPLVQLIDDIVQGGPGFVTALKALRSRALRSRK